MPFRRILLLLGCIVTLPGCVQVTHADATTFSNALSQALEKCTALAPGHEAELGNVDPSEVGFWFNSARLEALQMFWNPKGIEYLNTQLHATKDTLEKVCIRQLLDEAHVKDAVPPNYSLERTAASGHGVN